jgi:hypothetical protein
MFAKWPHLHRPDLRGPGQPGGLPGGEVTPDARAPGPVLGLNPPQPAWSYALSGSCNLGHFLSWTRMVVHHGTVYRRRHDVVHHVSVGRGHGRPAGLLQLNLAPAPWMPTRSLGLGLRSEPRTVPLLQRTCGRAPGTDPRAAGPCAEMAMTASESGCILRPVRARPAGVKIFQAR